MFCRASLKHVCGVMLILKFSVVVPLVMIPLAVCVCTSMLIVGLVTSFTTFQISFSSFTAFTFLLLKFRLSFLSWPITLFLSFLYFRC